MVLVCISSVVVVCISFQELMAFGKQEGEAKKVHISSASTVSIEAAKVADEANLAREGKHLSEMQNTTRLR